MTDDDLDPPADVERIAALVRDAAPTRFDDGFAQRVLDRVRAQREAPIVLALERQFVRIVPLAAAASLLLAAMNWWGGRDDASSVIDAALNLPQVTLSTAYTPASLYSVGSPAAENP